MRCPGCLRRFFGPPNDPFFSKSQVRNPDSLRACQVSAEIPTGADQRQSDNIWARLAESRLSPGLPGFSGIPTGADQRQSEIADLGGGQGRVCQILARQVFARPLLISVGPRVGSWLAWSRHFQLLASLCLLGKLACRDSVITQSRIFLQAGGMGRTLSIIPLCTRPVSFESLTMWCLT